MLYIAASLALVSMAPYTVISSTAGFASAFTYAGYDWASQLVQAGEVTTLPLVVLISLLAQPRLMVSQKDNERKKKKKGSQVFVERQYNF